MHTARLPILFLLTGTTVFALAGAMVLGGLGYYLGYAHGASAVLQSAGNGIGTYAQHAASRIAGAGSVADSCQTGGDCGTVALETTGTPRVSAHAVAVCAFLPCATGLE